MPGFEVDDFDHVVLTVADIDASIAFYQRVLGMQARSFPSARGGVRWALHFGERKLNLYQVGSEFEPHAAAAVSGSVDLCLLTRTPVADVRDQLIGEGVDITLDIDSADGATGDLTSIWFRDPDGNLIEIANRV